MEEITKSLFESIETVRGVCGSVTEIVTKYEKPLFHLNEVLNGPIPPPPGIAPFIAEMRKTFYSSCNDLLAEMKAIELKLTPVVSSLEKSGESVTALTESFAELESGARVDDKVLLTLLKLYAQRHGLSTVTCLTAPTFYQKLLADCKDGGLVANFNEEDVKNFVRREIRETQMKDHEEFEKQMADRASGGAAKKSG